MTVEWGRLEWRLVDASGVPHDPNSEGWPIFETRADAIDQLVIYREDDHRVHLETRRVAEWQRDTKAERDAALARGWSLPDEGDAA